MGIPGDSRPARTKVGAAKRPRTAAERREAQRILFAAKVGRPSKYRPDHHPEDVVAYFRQSYDALQEPERVETRGGNVKWVQPPVPPPTLAGYAAKIGVRRETLWAWGQRHEEFGEAVEICKAIQEHLLIQMGLLGAYPPGLTIFMLRNLLGWKEKVERVHVGGVTLHFDAQDGEA
ncbi:MAG: terminase small subunit [Planctomycetota bacterium]|nr:terminase small subunit [Planctomycetota bacterium]